MDSIFTPEQVANIRSLDGARWLAANFVAQKEAINALDAYRRMWPRSLSLSLVEKAAVPAGTTASGSWAGSLAGPRFPPELLSALVGAASPVPVLPRLNLPRVPFLRKVAIDRGATSGVNFWISGPGGSKTVIQNNFATVTFPPTTAAGIFVLSEEAFDFSADGSVEYLRDWLAWQITRFLDRQAFDPSIGPAGESFPASLLYGAPTVVATGNPASDVRALIAAFIAQGGRLERAAFVLSSENSAAFALIDSDAFDNLTVQGGRIAGIDAFASTAIGDVVALIDRSQAALASGDGNLTVSRHGSLLMSDESVSPPTEAQLVSLWQSNAVAIKFEKNVHWGAADGAAVYLTHNYAIAGSPS